MPTASLAPIDHTECSIAAAGLMTFFHSAKRLHRVAAFSLKRASSFNMAGFGQVVPNCIQISIDGGPTIPVAPLPLYVLLKLVAFSDRKAHKDWAVFFTAWSTTSKTTSGDMASTTRRRAFPSTTPAPICSDLTVARFSTIASSGRDDGSRPIQ